LKVDVVEVLILLDADLASSGICSVFEAVELDLDAGGRPLLEERGRERWSRLWFGGLKRMMGG